jgi:hypothetical protein
MADANKSLLARGVDPSVQRKIDRGACGLKRKTATRFSTLA